uniref:Uncharacterized protein n=1 Tax=Aegilops tauschii TaxID=37682 RepID=M8C2U4_AEGTA
MKLRSGRRLGSPAPPRSAGGADRISTLPDDLLLLVLAHLRCVRAAARASVLSRRWRDLWTRLPSLVFRDVVFPSVEPVLARVISSASSVSLLDICLRERPFSVRAAEPCVSVASLLRATAQLSPVQLILAIPVCVAMLYERVELPCFQRAKSISLSSSISLQPPATGELFPALTTLVLSGCSSDVGALVLRCPRLRVLRYTLPGGWRFGITVNSASLRELVVEDTEHWTFDTSGDPHPVWTQEHFTCEIEKHLQMHVAADLSVFDLELNLTSSGHVYGAVVFSLLKMHSVHTTIHRLKVAIPESTDKNKCQEYCGCVPMTSQIVSLTKLDEVEIDGFQEDNHEFNFLEHLLRCALMLKRVILRQSDDIAPREAKVHAFSIAHPSVECHYIISSGSVSTAL